MLSKFLDCEKNRAFYENSYKAEYHNAVGKKEGKSHDFRYLREKIGMIQIFKQGQCFPVTVVEVGLLYYIAS